MLIKVNLIAIAHGKGAGTLAPYFAQLVGEGTFEVHPELKPTPFDDIYDKDSMLEKIDQFMGECAAHTSLSTEAEPFDQQVLLLGGDDAPVVSAVIQLCIGDPNELYP